MALAEAGDLGEDVHLWPLVLDGTAIRQDHYEPLLSTDEAARAVRFHFARDRRRFVAGRGTLRMILARYKDVSRRELRFTYGSAGKPSLAAQLDGQGLEFNLSHCDHMGLLAVARHRVLGVDIERIRPARDLRALASRFFAPEEVTALESLPASLYAQAFFACWTRKEAFLKALGAGLTVPLDDFVVSVDPGKPARLLSTRWRPREADRWSLTDIVVGPDFRAALAIAGKRLPALRVRHLSVYNVCGSNPGPISILSASRTTGQSIVV